MLDASITKHEPHPDQATCPHHAMYTKHEPQPDQATCPHYAMYTKTSPSEEPQLGNAQEDEQHYGTKATEETCSTGSSSWGPLEDGEPSQRPYPFGETTAEVCAIAISPEPDPHVNEADDDDPSEANPGQEEEPDLEPWVRDFLEQELAQFETLTGVTHIAEHVITMNDDRPIKQRYYPKNPAMQRIIDEQVDELLKNNCIEPSKSPHSTPIVLVGKKSGDVRMCIDYRQLNANSIPDAYPLPRIHHILERLRNAKYISTLDLKSGYWQIPMARGSQEYTAFTVPERGLFHWKVIPGASLEEHVCNLGEVLRRLRHANLRLNRAKCKFFRRSLVYLGHVIIGEGIHTDPDKIAAVRELQPPATCRKLRRCLGIASWYRRCVPNFADIVQPMSLLFKKGQKWDWKPEQQAAFEELKARLTEAPVLACPDFSEKFVLQTDERLQAWSRTDPTAAGSRTGYRPSIPSSRPPARRGGLRALEAVRRVRPPSQSTSRVPRPSHHATTIARISQRYYWPGLFRNVARYVKQCEKCQKFKVSQLKPAGRMLTRQVEEPLGTLCADFIGPLPRSKHGNTMLLVFFDAFTKWVELIPLRKATSAHLERAFRENILIRFGHMAGRADEPSEAEGLILGERAGHSNRYPRRPHNADYEVHSPYNSDDSRGTDPTPDTRRREWDRLPDSSAVGNIFADEVNRQGAGNFELPILDHEDYAEVLAAVGDILQKNLYERGLPSAVIEVAEDLSWEEIDWVEIPADWRTFGLGTMVPAVVLDAVAVSRPKAPTLGQKRFLVEAEGKMFQVHISHAGRVTVALRPPNAAQRHQPQHLVCVCDNRAGFTRREYPRPSAVSSEDHTRSVRSEEKQQYLFCKQRPSPVHHAWELQSPVCGPSYRHTDSLPTDPTWRPDLRGVEGTLGRRDIVIRFLFSGLHPLAPPGRSELESQLWGGKARGERRNGSRESLLVLLDQSWVRSQVIRADFQAGTSAYPLTLPPLCPVVPDDLQIFCKQTLAGLRRRPRLKKLRYSIEKTLARSRKLYYWINMNTQIKKLVYACEICEKIRRNN
ncbi:hypothetical protein ACLKA7_001451 [Drosophila subpalustris]